MAKVQVTATALIRFGVMKNENASQRDDVLAIIGRNDKLLKEMQITNQPLFRVGKVGDKEDVIVAITPDKDNRRVTVVVRDVDGVLGGATYGYKSFFACVLDTSDED